jgi:hypothetical protein
MNLIAVRETQLGYIPVAQIAEDTPYCLRSAGDAAVVEIRSSFLRHGQTHPLVLEALSDGKFGILDGHRRLAAVRLIHAEGGTWHKLLAHVVPGNLTALDRFRILRERNDGADRTFGLAERGRLFAAFRRFGLCVATLANECGMTVAEVEDCLELADAPPTLAARIDRVRLNPVYAAMLVRRYRGWTTGPHAARADQTVSLLLGHAATEPLTIKTWRFLLDFYWDGDRPFMATGK